MFMYLPFCLRDPSNKPRTSYNVIVRGAIARRPHVPDSVYGPVVCELGTITELVDPGWSARATTFARRSSNIIFRCASERAAVAFADAWCAPANRVPDWAVASLPGKRATLSTSTPKPPAQPNSGHGPAESAPLDKLRISLSRSAACIC